VRIDAFAHALSPRYRARVLELLDARGDETAQQYAWMLGNDPTLTQLEARFALMDQIGPTVRVALRPLHPRRLAERHDGDDDADARRVLRLG
jgi:hypothetical protein